MLRQSKDLFKDDEIHPNLNVFMKFLFVGFIFLLFSWSYQGRALKSDLKKKPHFNITSPKESLSQKETGRNYSWFFDSVITKQELALMPTYFRSRVYGSNWGVRFFTFSTDKTGYYGSLSVLKQFLEPYFKVRSLYRRSHLNGWKIYFTAEYSNYFQPWYGDGGEGMKKVLSNSKEDIEKNWTDLYSRRISVNQKFLFRKYAPLFYGVGVSWILRKENLKEQEKRYFEDENFLFPKVTAGYENRDSQENTKKGQYHQASFGCALQKNGVCQMEGDFRFYFPVHNKVYLAFRGFAGMALFNDLTYSLAYSLGGSKVFRGFTYNRFRGDKVYFTQSELRADLWKEVLSGVLFFEMGEVAFYKEKFTAPRWDYGVGLRFGIPPSYKIKLRVDLGFSDKEMYNITVNFRQSF